MPKIAAKMEGPAADGAVVGGIVDVGLDDERVGAHGLGGVRGQFVSGVDQQVIDSLEGFGSDLGEVVVDASPIEVV